MRIGIYAVSQDVSNVMTKPENRCANCGGRFGLVSHRYLGLRFCRKACKDDFVAKHTRIRKWLGFPSPRERQMKLN